MTEAEWLAGADTEPMLTFLGSRGSNRKRRLFACACVRRVWKRLKGQWPRQAVEVAERFADGQAKKAELSEACQATLSAATDLSDESASVRFSVSAAYCAARAGVSAGQVAVSAREADIATGNREGVPQAGLLRCVFGNPFRPAALDAGGLASALPLAQAAYDERALPSGHLDPVRLNILADALEEAGAEDAVVAHLRSAGPHVRGCWALDLVLGKS